MIYEGSRTHRGVTGPMNFKKSGRFFKSRTFFGKACSRDFGAPGCHPSTLIDLEFQKKLIWPIKVPWSPNA